MSKSYLNYPIFVLYVAMFFAAIFGCYHTYFTYHRVKHTIYLLKSDKLEFRKSPLDRFAFLAAKALTYLKTGCESAPHVGVGLGLMIGADEVLKQANVEPFFGPFLGGALKAVLPKNPTNESVDVIKASYKLIRSNETNIREASIISDQLENSKSEGDLTKEEYYELRKLLTEAQGDLAKKDSALKAELKEKYPM